MSAIRPVRPESGVDYPGKRLGAIGLVLAILLGVVGLVISVIARSESRRGGYLNTPATIGVVVGAISTGMMVIAALAGVLGGFVYASF